MIAGALSTRRAYREHVMQQHWLRAILLLAAVAWPLGAAAADNVRVTPLGSHAGELCARDRATIFEDPSGVRILYDAGQSVTGGNDPRLGHIDVVLLSHAHGDHIGDQRLAGAGAGTCANPQVTTAAPHSTTAEIVAAKNAAIVMVSALGNFIGRKVQAIHSKPTPACPQTGEDIVLPLASACLALVQTGGTRTIKAKPDARPVEITVVPAAHDNALPLALLSESTRKNLEADGISYAPGPPSGYVVRFTNGLTVYLSGDTGVHSDMRTVAHDLYKVGLMELNFGATALTPDAAAYVVNTLVQPTTVLLSHVNEAATQGGKLQPGTRSAALAKLVEGRSLYPALSGRTMEFDGTGRCVAGC
jgi:L-ascorbate metabolism protein UlaG (beta-lactamase superfamily)